MISRSEPGGHPLDPRQPADKVTAARREQRNGHQGMIVWLTGLSGAGKTTIATELERRLFAAGRHTYLLDGDILRRGLCKDLGFSAEDRRENIRRVGEVAALFADAGCIAIAAFISPMREDRPMAFRRSCPRDARLVAVDGAVLDADEEENQAPRPNPSLSCSSSG